MAADAPVSHHTEIRLFATGEPPRGMYRLFPPATRTELWAGVGFLAVALFGAAWVLKCRFDALALEQDPVIVEGKVVQLWKAPNRRRWHCYVRYEYPAPPQMGAHVFRNETELAEQHFNRLQEGGPVAVKVCRTDPANHQVVGEGARIFSSSAALFLCLGILALLAAAGVFNLWWWWVSCGKPAPARVYVISAKTLW